MTEAKLTVHLDEQSKKAIDDLIARLDFASPIVATNEREEMALSKAKTRAADAHVSLPLTLLRMLVESESERERTHGFKGQIRLFEKRIEGLELDLASKQRSVDYWRDHAMKSEKERDTFSGQVDYMRKQIDTCHTKIETLETEIGARRDEAERWQIEWEKAKNSASRTESVRQMFVEVLPHQERNDRPTVPSEEAIRLQTRIDCEEFVEKIEALYEDPDLVSALKKISLAIAKHSPIRKDLYDRLPEFADALADNAVTNEGFAVLFGIDLEPVFREVHSANMRKKDGPIDETGKRKKPTGWVGPDVAGVLRKQGWRPSDESNVDEPIPYALASSLLVSEHECPVHGIRRFGEDDPRVRHCVRCENAQYNGSEIDPIGEQSDNETAALAYLAKEVAKVEAGPQKEPQRNTIPIDRSLWDRKETVEIPTALVKLADLQLVCAVLVCGNDESQVSPRRIFLKFIGDDDRMSLYEKYREHAYIHKLTIDGAPFGMARIAGIWRGTVRDDRKTYSVQIELAKG